MTPDTVKRLMDEYDEWHEGYLMSGHGQPRGVGTETRWLAQRQKIVNHLLRTPSPRPQKPEPQTNIVRTLQESDHFTEQSRSAPGGDWDTPLDEQIAKATPVVDESVDTRKQEL